MYYGCLLTCQMAVFYASPSHLSVHIFINCHLHAQWHVTALKQRNLTSRLERDILPCSRSESVTINLGASTFAFDIQVYLLAIYCTRLYSGLHLGRALVNTSAACVLEIFCFCIGKVQLCTFRWCNHMLSIQSASVSKFEV